MVQINFVTDATQREVIHDIARLIYATHGCKLPNDLFYLENSQHPTEIAVLAAAEQIFELLTGDTPDYSDDEDD